MTSAKPIPLRPVNVGALIEAADASGLSEGETGRLIDILLPESLIPSWMLADAMRRRLFPECMEPQPVDDIPRARRPGAGGEGGDE
jgi:hypothetical protein